MARSNRLAALLPGLVFSASVAGTALFAGWVVFDSDDDQVHSILVQFEEFVAKGEEQEGRAVLNETLAALESDQLAPIWLGVIRQATNGYDRLDYYLRVLRADPERELTYSEIANFIELAPPVFQNEVRSVYLADIRKVPGVRIDWLERYDLLN